jgi:hypothetical protein
VIDPETLRSLSLSVCAKRLYRRPCNTLFHMRRKMRQPLSSVTVRFPNVQSISRWKSKTPPQKNYRTHELVEKVSNDVDNHHRGKKIAENLQNSFWHLQLKQYYRRREIFNLKATGNLDSVASKLS